MNCYCFLYIIHFSVSISAWYFKGLIYFLKTVLRRMDFILLKGKIKKVKAQRSE